MGPLDGRFPRLDIAPALEQAKAQADAKAQAQQMLQQVLRAALVQPHTIERHEVTMVALRDEGDYKVLAIGLPTGIRIDIPLDAMMCQGLLRSLAAEDGSGEAA